MNFFVQNLEKNSPIGGHEFFSNSRKFREKKHEVPLINFFLAKKLEKNMRGTS